MLKRVAAWWLVLCLILVADVAAQQKLLTVERIYGQPSLNGRITAGLQWSPDGKMLAYLQGRGANAALWVMDVATGQRRALIEAAKLTSILPAEEEGENVATGLGRAARQRFQWSPDGRAMLFHARGDLFWFDLTTQTAKRLTSGGTKEPAEDAKISPDGGRVSFCRAYELWVVDVTNGKETRLTRGGSEEVMNGKLDWVYPEELGLRTAHWWSPDSKRIAYVQMDERAVTKFPLVNHLSYTGETAWMRYPKAGDANPVATVFAVPATGGQPVLLGSTKDDSYIPRVTWLRDGRRVALQKLNRQQNRVEVYFVEADSGKSTLVLKDEHPSFLNVPPDPYFFADGKRFLWVSQRSGFRHLYLYETSGMLVRAVTSGPWEASSVSAVDEKNEAVFFIGTEKSALERHLYRVGLSGGAPVRITKEDGTHAVSFAPDASHYVDTYSNVVTPQRQDLYRADGVRAHVVNENRVPELAEYGLVKPEYSTIPDGRGGTLNTMMIKPPNFDPAKKYPALMYTYGGPSSQVVVNNWGGARGLWHQMMAQKGYVIFFADNGGAAGRGHGSQTPMYRNLGEVEVAEQVTAANWLKAQPYIDPERVGIWGWSYGGYMACMLMTKAAGVWKAGFAGAPVTDWRQYDSIYTERYMGRPQDNAEGYANSAPTAHAAKLKGALMIAHGTGDDNVHFTNTLKMQEELIRAGKYAEVILYPGRGHGVGDAPAQRHLWTRVTKFFLDNL